MYEIILMNGIGSSLKVRPRLIFKAIGFGHNKMICSILPEINKSNFEFLKQYLNDNKKSIISFILLNIYENIITFLLLYIVMSSINIATPHIIQDYQKLALVGFSGVAAVTAQTLSLSWIHNIFEAQTKTGEQFTQMLRRIFTKRGIKSLYQGEFSKYRYSAFARFGDLISNVTVIDFFKNHQDSAIRQTPIFAQTLLSWTLASVWRFSILPLDVLSAQNLRGSFSANRLLTKLKYRKQKRVKSDINPLYSWLLVQNYLMAYTASVSYKQNTATAVLRNTLIGFASMSAFDLYKSVSNKIFGKIISQKYTFSGKKTTLRGLYGVVFCNVTQLFSQFSNQAHC